MLAYRTGEIGRPAASGWTARARSSRRLGDPARVRATRSSRRDGRPPRLRPHAMPATGKSDIWIRDLARGVSSRFTFGAGRRLRARLVSRRQPRSSTLGPRRDARPRTRKPPTARARRSSCSRPTQLTFATDWSRGRPVHRVLAAQAEGHELGHLDPARRSASAKPIPFAADAVQRGERRRSRRTAASRLPVERVRAQRDLRAELPGPGRQVAGLDRRRQPIRTGAATARSSSTARPIRSSWRSRSETGDDVRGRHPEAALPGRVRHRHRAQPRTSRRRTASGSSSSRRSGASDDADDGRPELVRRLGK